MRRCRDEHGHPAPQVLAFGAGCRSMVAAGLPTSKQCGDVVDVEFTERVQNGHESGNAAPPLAARYSQHHPAEDQCRNNVRRRWARCPGRTAFWSKLPVMPCGNGRYASRSWRTARRDFRQPWLVPSSGPTPRPPHEVNRHTATREFSREATKRFTRPFWMKPRGDLTSGFRIANMALHGSCGRFHITGCLQA